MFKLCIAIAVIGCVATISEGQSFNRQQLGRLPFYQQQQYQQQYQQQFQQFRQPSFFQQNRFQQSPFFAQQRPSYYNPINAYNRNTLNNYNSFPAFAPQRAYTNEGLARTIVHNKNARPDGAYEYNYETENGIRGAERNIPKILRSGESSGNAEGSYGYTSPEGLQVSVNYEANEDGFKPVLTYGGNGAGQFVNSPEPSSVIINRRP